MTESAAAYAVALASWVQAIGSVLAILVAAWIASSQTRENRRREDRRTAERVRSLARLFNYQHEVCRRSYRLRELQGSGQPVDQLNLHLGEFNFVCAEINKFNFVDAPSLAVLHEMIDYRQTCATLSEYMQPNHDWAAPTDLGSFAKLIEGVRDRESALNKEADVIEGRSPRLIP